MSEDAATVVRSTLALPREHPFDGFRELIDAVLFRKHPFDKRRLHAVCRALAGGVENRHPLPNLDSLGGWRKAGLRLWTTAELRLISMYSAT
jgi:hypothetical protein